jgi:aspartokinase/homoserine dehydrogenase 1
MPTIMKILKFGGSSVANADNIAKVIRIASKSFKKDKHMIVVVSALGGVTDSLIRIASLAAEKNGEYKDLLAGVVTQHDAAIRDLVGPKRKKGVNVVLAQAKKKYDELSDALKGIHLLGELSPRSLDHVASFGEQLSAHIISEAMKAHGLACTCVDSRELIKTDNRFGCAAVHLQKSYGLMAEYFAAHPGLSVMGGFIASTDGGVTTTLGRGGSDYTASLVGAAVGADAIEIWTDVDGVLTADPRKVEKAFPLPGISYEEAGELAHFGAKVIHPKTMKPARLKNIPIDIKNTFNPGAAGTRISNEVFTQTHLIKGISSLSGVSLLRIQSTGEAMIGETAAKIFDALSRANIEILLTTQASYEQAISIAVHKDQSRKAQETLEKAFTLELKAQHVSPVSVEENLSVIAIVGKHMKGVPGISGKLFNTLGDAGINIVAIAQGSSELNVSVVISSHDEKRALQAIHGAFFEAVDDAINLFMIGTGLIGSTLLKQIRESKAPVRLCGLANHTHTLVDPAGIPASTGSKWKEDLKRGNPMNLQRFAAQMIELKLPRSVFVDCTASEEVAAIYGDILAAGIAVVTPNKKANSGSFKQYRKLHALARESNTPFIYETNVGAGLPIIRTIQSLVASGDEILKIEAILSGTLSYIFNTFSSGDLRFSRVVRDAKAKGYTEPDPRDDLSGMDVARKILILAREAGLKTEPDQVRIGPILPKKCFSVGSVDAFFAELEKLDRDFEKKRSKARKSKRVLRYIAALKNGKATIELVEVAADHPFYNLSGSDNIVSITTKRYSDTPLVIKGPGAGAEVTAGGVLANILNAFK